MLTNKRSQETLAAAIHALNTDMFGDRLCDWLKATVNHDSVTGIAYFQNKPPATYIFSNLKQWVLDNFEKTYIDGAYLLDPFHELHTKKAPQGVYRLQDISPDQFRRNRYFLEYYQNTTLIDEIGFIAYPADGVSFHVCLGRDSSSNTKFSARDFSISKMVAPVVCALIERNYDQLNTTGKYEESTIIANLIKQAKKQHQISLSPRQAQVAMLILRGHSSMSIGLQLEISHQTVKVFRKQLYKKCKISSQAELFSLMLPLLKHEV